ncbi:S1 family peptidase [Rhodovulum marinum]|uniref:Trypsin-like peptidase n=1 Tax=Rhodovulum marinum TaxID=320662 RepID=A0A4V2SR62_9RHOB|nr:serine protease [Rhodovulum marinum]TCP41876.1 trypsin-like peptidase [Rhodovulum marinum]
MGQWRDPKRSGVHAGRPRIATLALFAALMSAAPGLADEVADTVIYIECTDRDGKLRVGSGVLVSEKGHVLTAEHVAPPGSNCVGAQGVADSRNAEPLIRAPERVPGSFDVALLQFARTATRPFLKFCPLDDGMIRKRIFAAGFPNGTESFNPSFRSGIMSTTRMTSDGIIETDSLLTQGMSGGPILADDEKTLIGIVSGAKFDDLGEPAYYGITPIARITSDTFRLSENPDGCYPDRPTTIELKTEIDALAGQIATARDEIGGRLDALEARTKEVEKNTGFLSADLLKLRSAFASTKTMADKTFESLAGKIENIAQRQAQENFEQVVAEALEGRPIRKTLDEIYEDLAEPIWRFSGRVEGGWVTMTLAYERQISAPVFSQSLRFCLTPLFLPAEGGDVTVSETPTVKGFYTFLDERFRTTPAIVRTCQAIDHSAVAGRGVDGPVGRPGGAEGAPVMALSGQYQYPYADNFVQQHFFFAEARREAGQLEPWNGWYYLQVVKETVTPGNGGETTPEIVLRAIIDATIDESEGYESPVILPCKVYSAGIGRQGGDMLALDPARQMSDLLSSETPRLEQNETCYSDPS